MNEHEIDYKTSFDNALRNLEETVKMQTEYFELMAYISDKDRTKTPAMVADNMFRLTLEDQLLVLKVLKTNVELSEHLCKKYGLEEKEND